MLIKLAQVAQIAEYNLLCLLNVLTSLSRETIVQFTISFQNLQRQIHVPKSLIL